MITIALVKVQVLFMTICLLIFSSKIRINNKKQIVNNRRFALAFTHLGGLYGA
jgi:hypothetical protein